MGNCWAMMMMMMMMMILGTGHSTLVPGYTSYHIYVLVPDILSSGCSMVSVTCLW